MAPRALPLVALGLSQFLALAGCLPALPPPGASAQGLTAQVITVSARRPKSAAPGACWDTDIIPAVIETVTEQTLVSPELRDDGGTLVRPATYRSVAHLKMLQDRSQVWFRVPCPEAETEAFWASVQRALKARGYYLLTVTGQNDPGTAQAVRRFQAERGLDSPILSLAAARELGLAAVPLDQLR